MWLLGIESSCDETGVALVRAEAGQALPQLVAQALHTQAAMHEAYGGVVPELASRDHVRRVLPLIRQVMAQAEQPLSAIDVVAFTRGPGLAGALLVGAGTACALAASLGKPVMGIHHLEGHLLSPFLSADPPTFPFIALLVSGGHTQLIAVKGVGDYVRLGTTLDDAIGEAFDKVAKMLGLPYPGGPHLERAAVTGDPARFELPRPMHGRPNADFSLSGLKTAVRLTAERAAPLTPGDVADLCASFQGAVVDVIMDRTRAALKMFRTQVGEPCALVVAGGVAANNVIRSSLQRFASGSGLKLVLPPPALCTDNGAMIAWTGIERLRLGMVDDLSFAPRPRWPLDTKAQRSLNGKA